MCGQSRYKSSFHEEKNEFFNRGPIDEKEWREFKRFKRDKENPEAKFYKHLTWYLAIMGFFLYKNHGNVFSFFPIAFFWGIGVTLHYFSVFGWPNELKGKSSDDRDEPEDEQDEPQDKGPNWSDKDLV
jgi:hypothetical protein